MPDQYCREGYHEINLVNGKWNECFIEMSELARDKVTKISFAIEVFGKERTMGDSLKFDLASVQYSNLQRGVGRICHEVVHADFRILRNWLC